VKLRFETKNKCRFKEVHGKCFEQQKIKHNATTYGFFYLCQWKLDKR